jgi:histidine ammonia-lyase
VTTGFGALADTHIGGDNLSRMQAALVRSHAAAGRATAGPTRRCGRPSAARGRARWPQGCPAAASSCPALLLELLNRGLCPDVPRRAPVGCSGDLAQLAHLALPLIGEGRLRRVGDPAARPSAEVLAGEGLTPLVLQPKEGLSLLNGTEPMQACSPSPCTTPTSSCGWPTSRAR